MTPDDSRGGGDHVIVLACGTRGDVQPLSLLAQRLHGESPRLRIDFVTHSAHEVWLQLDPAVQCHWLPQPPARIWVDAAAPVGNERNANVRAALLDCCINAVRLVERQQGRRRLILCNLFSLEGFHLAEALGCCCIVASPCLVPYPAPVSFERRFRAAFPQLHHRLQAAGPGEVGWGEVDHWLWPLFSDSWQRWRQEVLGLPAVPFQAEAQAEAPLPPAPPLLYGLPEMLVPRPGYWPDSVHMCGFWLHQQGSAALSELTPPEAASFVAAGGTVAVDLGSMPRMGFVPDAVSFAAALRGALQAAGLRGLLLTGSYQPLAEACQVSDSAEAANVLQAVAEVPHAALLPHCCAVMHHGGAGTTAAALAAGTPQLVCPLHFDQFAQAGRVEHLGLGLQLPSARQLLAGTGSEAGRAELQCQLAARLRGLQQPALLRQCSSVAAELRRQPDGLAVAAQRILEQLSAMQPAANGALPGMTSAMAAMLAAERDAGVDPDWHAADAGRQLTCGTSVQACETQLCELAPGFSVYTACPDEARFIHGEIFRQRCYLRHGITISAGDAVVDCGANIGLFTLSLLMAAPVPSRIVAAEPLPPNLALLRRNLALHATAHGGSCDVRVLPVALGAAGGSSRRFTFFPNMPGNSTAALAEKAQLQAGRMPAARFANQHTAQCPVVTLSEVMRQEALQRVDLLKNDVEGMELQVLQGIEEHHWPCIRQVVAEVHDVMDAGISRIEAVQMLLRSHSFDCMVKPTELDGTVLVYAVQK